MKVRDGKLHRAVEVELLPDDPEGAPCRFTIDRPIHDVIRNISDGVGQLGCGDDFGNFRHLVFLFSPLPAPPEDFLLREGEVFLCHGFVVRERGERHGEVLTPLASFSHVIDDFWDQIFILFLRVLFVEDAVLPVVQVHAAEAGCAVVGVVAVQDVFVAVAET